MHIFYEDREMFYNYLVTRSTEFRLSDMSARMLRDLTTIQIFPNLTMSSVDRSKISMNLVLSEVIDDTTRNELQEIMKNTRVHTVRVNRFCYISSYVEHNRGVCIAEAEQLYNQLVEFLVSCGIDHEFQIEVSWGGTDNCIATTHFFPETTKWDWYSHTCVYHAVTYETFLQSLLAALIGADGLVYYDSDFDETKVLKYLMHKGIYLDVKTICSKVQRTADVGIAI